MVRETCQNCTGSFVSGWKSVRAQSSCTGVRRQRLEHLWNFLFAKVWSGNHINVFFSWLVFRRAHNVVRQISLVTVKNFFFFFILQVESTFRDLQPFMFPLTESVSSRLRCNTSRLQKALKASTSTLKKTRCSQVRCKNRTNVCFKNTDPLCLHCILIIKWNKLFPGNMLVATTQL